MSSAKVESAAFVATMESATAAGTAVGATARMRASAMMFAERNGRRSCES
jgi:hypothetical protein